VLKRRSVELARWRLLLLLRRLRRQWSEIARRTGRGAWRRLRLAGLRRWRRRRWRGHATSSLAGLRHARLLLLLLLRRDWLTRETWGTGWILLLLRLLWLLWLRPPVHAVLAGVAAGRRGTAGRRPALVWVTLMHVGVTDTGRRPLMLLLLLLLLVWIRNVLLLAGRWRRLIMALVPVGRVGLILAGARAIATPLRLLHGGRGGTGCWPTAVHTILARHHVAGAGAVAVGHSRSGTSRGRTCICHLRGGRVTRRILTVVLARRHSRPILAVVVSTGHFLLPILAGVGLLLLLLLLWHHLLLLLAGFRCRRLLLLLRFSLTRLTRLLLLALIVGVEI